MKELEAIPEDCRPYYARLIVNLVKAFSVDNLSGKAEINFKEGKPMTVEPSPRISLNK